LLYLTKASSCA